MPGNRIEVSSPALCEGRTVDVIVLDRGEPCAPLLVKAFEEQERDAAGEAETAKKGIGDTSHPVAAIRYALWRPEGVRRLPQGEAHGA